LTTHVEELIRQLADLERGLGDSGCFAPTPEDVRVCGEIARCGHAIDRTEVVDDRVVQLEFTGAPYGLPHAGIPPESSYGISNISRENICFYLGWESQNNSTASVVLWGEVDFELLHRIENGT